MDSSYDLYLQTASYCSGRAESVSVPETSCRLLPLFQFYLYFGAVVADGGNLSARLFG